MYVCRSTYTTVKTAPKSLRHPITGSQVTVRLGASSILRLGIYDTADEQYANKDPSRVSLEPQSRGSD